MYLAIDGIEGSGKTSLVAKLAEDYEAIKIIEPGQTEYGKAIRELLLWKNQGDMAPMTECLLFMADRNETYNQITKPALLENKLVISDRSFASTFAYQCVAGGLDQRRVMRILESIDLDAPDKLVVIDLPVAIAKARTNGKKLDRFERMESEYHEKVRQGYLILADEIVNGDQEFEDVYQELVSKVPELQQYNRMF